ncbi:MAG TPA: helix-turn-helix transcriptional regulator [Candidatus Acidoferrum sp.]|nr:helix-turn-helix transcriptional regulator [Candidatus Acidoferrum sp.]
MNLKRKPKGTNNVLVDLGFEDAEELTAKAELAVKLNDLLDKRKLSQAQAAAITGMTQPKISQIRRYKLLNISLERLLHAFVALDQHVQIVIKPARQTKTPGISIAA